jgi:integrase
MDNDPEQVAASLRDQKAQPRRTRVKNRPSIYYRNTASGHRRYEIGFLDSTGHRRWQTLEGNLKDAEAALEEIRHRRRRGERISPSRATLAEVAREWLETQVQLRPRTRDAYASSLSNHILPRLGQLRIAEITDNDIALLIAEMHAKGYKGWTIRSTLNPLSRILGNAARRGLIASNPMRRLERGERPPVGRREMRILSRDEIESMIRAATPAYRPLLATAVFTGLRQGELLGLTWGDIDFENAALRVRKAMSRDGQRTQPKTPQAIRDVVLMAAHRNVSRRGLELAVRTAGLERPDVPKLRFHDLRHTFASLLIAQGANVVFVSRQLGHASPDITLRVYAHVFDGAEHAQRTTALLDEQFGDVLR